LLILLDKKIIPSYKGVLIAREGALGVSRNTPKISYFPVKGALTTHPTFALRLILNI
jgi:hypothetical protein